MSKVLAGAAVLSGTAAILVALAGGQGILVFSFGVGAVSLMLLALTSTS